jgi:hypothetical protein
MMAWCFDSSGVQQGSTFVGTPAVYSCQSSVAVQAFVSSDNSSSIYTFSISGLSNFTLNFSTPQPFTDAGVMVCDVEAQGNPFNCGQDPTLPPYSTSSSVAFNPANISSGSTASALTISVSGSGDGLVFYLVSQSNPPAANVGQPAGLTFTISLNQIVSILPHFAAGSSWITGITLVNTGTQVANFSLAFFDNTGAPATLTFSSLGTGSILSASIAAQGSAYYEAGDGQQSLLTGWIQVVADQTITVQELFRNLAPNGSYYEASVPTEASTTEFVIPFDGTTFPATGAQLYTGLAIANLDSSDQATVTCTVRTSTGAIITGAIPTVMINPLGHWSAFNFPLLVGNRGTIDCGSTTTVAALGLRFLGNYAYSSLPVILK